MSCYLDFVKKTGNVECCGLTPYPVELIAEQKIPCLGTTVGGDYGLVFGLEFLYGCYGLI